MKFLFVSPEKALRHRYQRSLLFRVAGAAILALVGGQLPLLVSAMIILQEQRDQSARRAALLTQADELERQNGSLKEVRLQLAQIRQWEPILRRRVPVSALLGLVETTIPDNLVIDSIAMEADQYDRAEVSGGTYRVPTNYRVLIQGKARKAANDPVQTFADRLQKHLPAGTELVRAEHPESPVGNVMPFFLQYSIKPDGNYFGLGLTKIGDPSSL